MQSFIIFSNNCELKKITVTSSNVSVGKRNQLKSLFKRELQNTSPKLTTEDIKYYFQILKPFMHADDETKQLHIEIIKGKLSKL